MVSKDWVMKFSDIKKVKIIPYNPKVRDIFKGFKKVLREVVGTDVEIEHRGATALGISGEGEIDLYIKATPEQWKKLLKPLKDKFGEPGSIDHEWARFNHIYKKTMIEIMLVHKNCKDNIENQIFFNYLKKHPKALKEYEQLKTKYAKVSKREYYIQKGKFIQNILNKAKR